MMAMTVTAALIKDLREKSGAGMLDCKKALEETQGNVEDAIDWLRKKGLAAAAKKSGRVAAEGLVAVSVAGTKGVVVELNAETDFVARNEDFQALVANVASVALAQGADVEVIKAATYTTGGTVAEAITAAISTIGENMNLRRAAQVSVSEGLVVSYIHNATKAGMGKIGVLVGLQSAAPAEKLETLGKQLAMHIAAAKPEALNRSGVDASRLEREREVLIQQSIASGKSPEIAEKMVEGRIRKFYEEVVLLEQLFVMDGKTPVQDVVAAAAKEAGAAIEVTGYSLFILGEGIEKEEVDFAAEVAKAVNG
jgi:elongation factor Ts